MPNATENKYPAWICQDCGSKYGRWPKGHLGTFHIGSQCGWCGRTDVPVTEPRDYSYPPLPETL